MDSRPLLPTHQNTKQRHFDYFRATHSPSSAGFTPSNGHESNPAVSSSKKRSRADTLERNVESPYESNSVESSMSFGAASPDLLVNTKYKLAGGMDTPTRDKESQFECLGAASERDFRKKWTSSSSQQKVEIGALERERNGRKRGRVSLEPVRETWGQYVYNMVGGIAGRMWEFCRTSAFGEFTAGGNGAGRVGALAAPLRRTNSDSNGSRSSVAMTSTPIPGQYPEDADFDINTDSDVEVRPTKRQQISQAGDWVIVNRPSVARTPSSQTPYYMAPSQRPFLSRHASYRVPASRRARPSTARLSFGGSPQPKSQEKVAASYASPRSPAASPRSEKPPSSTTTATAELDRYAAKRRREERQADESMQKINHQLKAMIKQGKEALSSKVEVQDVGFEAEDMADEDDGFAEEYFYAEDKAG